MQRGLYHDIIKGLEQKGFRLFAMKHIQEYLFRYLYSTAPRLPLVAGPSPSRTNHHGLVRMMSGGGGGLASFTKDILFKNSFKLLEYLHFLSCHIYD